MNSPKETFYITTPIYYPSDKLHIGHAYCSAAADAAARYHRLRGHDVLFLTGTDEHGQKIEQKATEAGCSPKEFVDRIVSGPGGILELWSLMNLSYDRFIRTTDDYHAATVQAIFKRLYEQGDIYKSAYHGKYCTPCESFWTEGQLQSGNCPDCGRPVRDASEEAYFFRLSRYRDRILELYEGNPGFLEPESRRNEMINNFIRPGLTDLCVSRSSFTWGIPVSFDPSHVVYVWIDALSNYISALGYENDRFSDFERFWPCDVHFAGKEIVRFHAIIWPALLMALGLPLPKKIYGHGWLLFGGEKMSKSKGNVADPLRLMERYSADALRYFLLREFHFGGDGQFSCETLIGRINTDLANDLGNLISRTTAMAEQYFGGCLPEVQEPGPADEELIRLALGLREKYAAHMEGYAFQNALAEVWTLIARANKYIDETTPWLLAKEGNMPRLARVLYNLAEGIRVAACLLSPFMPETSEKIASRIGAQSSLMTWACAGQFGLLPAAAKLQKGASLFPRLDKEKELSFWSAQSAEASPAPAQAQKELPAAPKAASEIDISHFGSVEMKVARVLSCERVKNSDKLLVFQLDCGEASPRQVVSGIAQRYEPEALLSKHVVVVTNLKPVTLRGVKSSGMILSAETDGGLTLITVSEGIAPGSVLG